MYQPLQERGVESSISGYVRRVHGCRTEDKFYSLVGNVLYIYGAHEVRMTFSVFFSYYNKLQ